MGTQIIDLHQVHRMQMKAVHENDAKLMEQVALLLEQLCSQHTDQWLPLFYLANCFNFWKRSGLAIPLLWRASELANHKRHEIFNNLGTCYRNEHQVEKAKDALMKSVAIYALDADCQNNLGTLYINEGSPDEAIKYLRKAIEIKPDHLQAHWNLGLALLERQEWADGWDEYSWGLASKDRMIKYYTDSRGVEVPWWDGSFSAKKNIVFYGEQGIGDEILFASQIPDLCKKFGGVIFDCHERLINLFERSFPGVKFYPTRKIFDEPLDWPRNHVIHYKTAAAHAPKFLRRQDSDFPRVPYLKAHPGLVNRYRKVIQQTGPGPYLGISWVGGHKRTRKDIRSVSLDQWMPLFNQAKTILSLQYTDNSDDVEAVAKSHGEKIYEFVHIFNSAISEKFYPLRNGQRIIDAEGKELWFRDKESAKEFRNHNGCDKQLGHEHLDAFDYDHTAAFVVALHSLGGVIATVNTSLVHLCGALGLPCIVLTPFKCAWRYHLDRKDIQWYPEYTIRQFRQTPDGDWSKAMQEAALEMQYLLDEKRLHAVDQ